MRNGSSSPVSASRRSIFRRNTHGAKTEEEEGQGQVVAGIAMDRLSFVNTALLAIPGITLRTFFAPILNVKRILLNRKRITKQCVSTDPDKLEKMFREAIHILTKALVDASLEILETPIPLEERELAAALRGKLTPACYEPGAVLTYPGEFPETLFVHVVLSGSAQVVNYQPQNRKGPIFDSSMRKQYFVFNDLIRLNGCLGFQPELFKLLNTQAEPLGDGISDVASTSNVSTAIQRSLRRASRIVGQPTLLATRTELHRAPYVCCAAETLGFEPFSLATITAEATAPSGKRDYVNADSRVTQTMRIRIKDLHNALIELAVSQLGRSKSSHPANVASRHTHTLADHITAARIKAISRHYPLNEILMRQSWLLQDTPASTIRALATQLVPNSYFPGEVILCPHTARRHLCFLRRGTMTIEEAPVTGPKNMGECQCASHPNRGEVLQVVSLGASFGELSVLFGEPKHFVLRAQTICDVWCLSHRSFAATVKRDDVLRENLLSKAAALRMRWLGEQRFTASLAQKLREYCELFREAPDSFIRLVQERIEPFVHPPGTLLTSTSTRCEHMLIILHGRATSIVDGVAEYGPGSVIGEPTIILHRWPLGLVSRSMVEGWKLTRNHLRDVLNRSEILRTHSGEVGPHVVQIMQRVFAPPVPPCEVDALGRSRMPLVGAPPRGKTYLDYAKWLAEVQLKALCFRYSDYVKWSDISYSSLHGERTTESTSEPRKRKNTTSSLLCEASAAVSNLEGGANAVPQGMKLGTAWGQKKRKVVAGNIFPFYVNPTMTYRPFARPTLRKPPTAVDDSEDSVLAKQRFLKRGLRPKSQKNPLPHLQQVMDLLGARKKLQKAVESKQSKMNELEKERMNVADVVYSSLSTTNGGGPPPIHIFLQGSNPRVQITVEEAISVGYVLQFPDAEQIQSSVSNIDSDVTIGPPQHRQRRRDMAFTPNDRHHRCCFLFAASQLGDRSVDEAMLRENATEEADTREKAQQLTTLLVAKLAERLHQSIPAKDEMPIGALSPSTDWQKVSPSQSPAPSGEVLSPSLMSALPRTKPPPLKEADEQAFLHQILENPDRAMSKIRLKFQVPRNDDCFGGSSEVPEGNCVSSFPETAPVPKDDLIGRLRRISLVKETQHDPTAAGSSSRPPLTNAEDGGTTANAGSGSHLIESFLKQEGTPMFVDGYGGLGVSQTKPTEDHHTDQIPLVEIIAHDPPYKRKRSSIPSGRSSANVSAWLPQNFLMPSVNEATATMRRIQCDVNGLNAVAEEQRRDRLRRCHQTNLTDNVELLKGGKTALEYRHMLEEWTTAYRERACDRLCPAIIPSPLLSEAGHDYLSEEFRFTRRQHRVISVVKDVEMWRTAIGDGERPGAKSQEDTRECTGRDFLAVVGPRKLAMPSKPLCNPLAQMRGQEYQKWVAECDAIFTSAVHEVQDAK